ncbi:MAG: hypothetical protein AAB316_02045, partial [Bacteroidota bacterium]
RSGDGGENWDTLSGNWFVKVLMVQGDTIIVDALQGTFRSEDNGSNWVSINNSWTGQFNGFYFQQGVLFGFNEETVAFSNDLGTTWPLLLQDDTKHFSSLVKSGGLFLVGTENGCLRSTDFGANWVYSNGGLTGAFGSFRLFALDEHLVATDGDQMTHFSTDNGETWKSPLIVGDDNGFNSIVKKGAQYFGALEGQGLYQSSGNLLEWTKVFSTGFPASANHLFVHNDELLATYQESIFRSSDNGLTWTQSGTMPFAPNSVVFGDGTFYLTNGAQFRRSADFGNSWVAPTMFGLMATGGYHQELMFYQNRLYLASTPPGIFTSHDGGETWLEVTENISTQLGIYPAMFDFAISDSQFITWGHSPHGALYTPDLGGTWASTNAGLPVSTFAAAPQPTLDATSDAFIFKPHGSLWRRSFDDFEFANVTGQVYLDANNNGQFDPDESPLPGIKVLF